MGSYLLGTFLLLVESDGERHWKDESRAWDLSEANCWNVLIYDHGWLQVLLLLFYSTGAAPGERGTLCQSQLDVHK